LKGLDPACGTGKNFKLELETHTIEPHQFLGLEINPRAASIAKLGWWICYLQWHFRLHDKRTPPEPMLRAFRNIQCRDAVLACDEEPQPVTWEMTRADPDLPDLPEEVREQGRAGCPLPAAGGASIPARHRQVARSFGAGVSRAPAPGDHGATAGLRAC
jgi:hypothetical protein